MRITFLVNRDIESNIALNILIKKLSHHTITIFLSDHVGRGDNSGPDLYKLKYYEQTLFNEIVFPDLEKSSPENRFLTFNELGEVTVNGASSLNDINSTKGLGMLRDASPDVIISIRYGSIIQTDAISFPKYGVLNLHSGRLPEYRGVMATFWAMLNHERNMGCTLHYITDGTIDTGPVISSSQQTIDYKKDYLSNVIGLYPDGCELIINALSQIEAGKSLESNKAEGESNYYTFPKAEDFDRFKQNGNELYNMLSLSRLIKKYYVYDM